MELPEKCSVYANAFPAQVTNNGGFVSFIVIIRTTLKASTTLVVMHVGGDFIGATGLKDCSLLRKKDFLFASLTFHLLSMLNEFCL